MSGDTKFEGKPLARFDTMNAVERGMTETGREIYWVAPDGRVYDSITFSDGACWITLEASTLNALLELQTNIEFFSSTVESNFLKIEEDAKELGDSFRAALAAIKYKPLKQEKF